ncbi:hypothetical protein LCGC14_0511210 [marine sediment metagenome]|uniref:Uncharacterized protein n=1 Tax=marine sediment metagenome TaxID=412755 RepID=A0A0F9S171_9ZZZZ
MLYPKIMEVSTAKATGATYYLVRFWLTAADRAAGKTPFLVEDFVDTTLRPTGTRLIDPDDETKGSEAYDIDLPAAIKDNIKRYIVSAERLGYQGDNTSRKATASMAFKVGGETIRKKGARILKPIVRDQSDPNGVLAKPEVKDMEGKDLDVSLAAVGP